MVQAKTTNYYIYVYGLLLSQGLIWCIENVSLHI
jgi:hypothetical protein